MIRGLLRNNLVVLVVVVVGSGGAGKGWIWLKQDRPGVNGCRSWVKGTQGSTVLVSTSVHILIPNKKKVLKNPYADVD